MKSHFLVSLDKTLYTRTTYKRKNALSYGGASYISHVMSDILIC